MKLNYKHKLVLAQGINSGGYIRTSLEGKDVFGTTESAVRELRYLMATGNIQRTDSYGVFRVLKAPQESFDMAKNIVKNFTPQVEEDKEYDPEQVDIILKNAEKTE